MTLSPETPGPDATGHTAQVDVEGLIRANEASNQTMLDLVDQVRAESSVQEKKVALMQEQAAGNRRLLYVALAAVTLMILIGVANLISISQARHNAAVTANAARDAQGTYALLLGCLDVNSECGRRSAERQSQLLDEIKRYELVGFYCIRNNPAAEDPKAEDFLACVKRLYPTGPALPNP